MTKLVIYLTEQELATLKDALHCAERDYTHFEKNLEHADRIKNLLQKIKQNTSDV